MSPAHLLLVLIVGLSAPFKSLFAAPEIIVEASTTESCENSLQVDLQLSKPLNMEVAGSYLVKRSDTHFTACGKTPKKIPSDFDVKIWLQETPHLNFSKLPSSPVEGPLREKLKNISQMMRRQFGIANERDFNEEELLSVDKIWDKSLSSCHHVAAVYTALARKNGIPARIVYGIQAPLLPMKNTLNYLHAWVEVVDTESKKLIAVEPLAEDAKLFNEFLYIAFAADQTYDPASMMKDWINVKGRLQITP